MTMVLSLTVQNSRTLPRNGDSNIAQVVLALPKQMEKLGVELELLRAVCCKYQLRSCNIEKPDFPKLCQNKGLGELVLKI